MINSGYIVSDPNAFVIETKAGQQYYYSKKDGLGLAIPDESGDYIFGLSYKEIMAVLELCQKTAF